VAESVEEIPQREFGYTSFDHDSLVRHKTFGDLQQLEEFLVKKMPSNFFHSSAFYLFPEKEMHQKEWLGATLVFDLDADHLIHRGVSPLVLNLCQSCDEIFENEDPCPNCGSSTTQLDWIREDDLETVKRETGRLLDALTDRFGFDDSSLCTYFSGSRGYHVHVSDESLKELSSEERNEIVDYLMMVGYSLRYEDDPNRRTYERLLRIALAEEVPDALEDGEKATLSRVTERFRYMSPADPVSSLLSELPKELIGKIEDHIREKEMVGVDPVVTTDTHRLIRVPESLHSKTAMTKRKVDSLDRFDPFRDAIAVSEQPIEIFVRHAPEIFFDGEEYGPYHSERVRVPGYVAAYLLGRGVAHAE
jgi:DNA primase small subunit